MQLRLFLSSLVISGVAVAGEDSSGLDLCRQRDDRIAAIRAAADLPPATGECRYLSADGNDEADGKTPATAWRTTTRLEKERLASGTQVRFRRGDWFRGGFRAQEGVTYAAYGKGPKPVITPSPENGADPKKWIETEIAGVWSYQLGDRDVGTIVFDGGKNHAIKILPVYNDDGTYTQQYGGAAFNHGYADLQDDLHFWHDYSAKTDFKPFAKGTGRVYLKSDRNPGERFRSIEFNVRKCGVSVGSAKNVRIDNLCVLYSGHHGVGAGTAPGLKVTNCEFGWIGGSIQSERLFGRKWAVRFGNAVEVWGGCDDFEVSNCYIHDVYDAGITQQFSIPKDKPEKVMMQRNMRYVGNVIEHCNYSIEYFLSNVKEPNPSRMEGFLIESNQMWNAGVGLCRQRPDRNQAAHLKSWRNWANRATGFVVRGNVFAYSDGMMLEVSSGLMNPDGSDSMPLLADNVFLGEEGQRFGVLNQGKPIETKYDGATIEKLTKMGNKCISQVTD